MSRECFSLETEADSRHSAPFARANFGANTLGNLTYSYDQRGLRTQVGGSFARTNLPAPVTSASYDAANELLNWNGTPISYDANGNMSSDGSNAFTWNARNQVATLNSVTLQYDALGRRVKNAAGKSFLYDGANATQELSSSTVTANLLSGGVDEVFGTGGQTGRFLIFLLTKITSPRTVHQRHI
jgi:hypothetical protein